MKAPAEWLAIWALTLVRVGIVLASVAIALLAADPNFDPEIRSAFLNGLGLEPDEYNAEEAQSVALALAFPGLVLLAQIYFLARRHLPGLRWACGLDVLLSILRLSVPLGAIPLLLSFRPRVKEWCGLRSVA